MAGQVKSGEFSAQARSLEAAIRAAHQKAAGPTGQNHLMTRVKSISYETGGVVGARDFHVTVTRS